ncbi:unnamed protein product [Calicophoron daubneyi]|uniref:EF-hand domain-containing protein n=1 Tax=Calicophoron daubneyi TaxID=300641 RepID=A0AAV2TKG6_CALDB
MSTSEFDNQNLKASAKKALSEAKDPAEKLRAQCLLRGVTGIHGFGRMFRIMDDDSSHSLSKEEFIKGCHDYGCNLTQAEVDQLFKMVDKDGSGTIVFDELLKILRPPMSESRVKITKMAFDKMDRSGDGRITVEDLEKTYQARHDPKCQSSKMSEKQVLEAYLNSFELNSNTKDAIVTWDEFLNYYSGVSASIDSDAYYDLMMRNAFKL